MTVLLIAGSPSEKSRSVALLDGVQQRLQARGAHVERLFIRDLSPQALILADFGHPSILHAASRVANADVVVVATPVYKAAYSGVLKVFFLNTKTLVAVCSQQHTHASHAQVCGRNEKKTGGKSPKIDDSELVVAV